MANFDLESYATVQERIAQFYQDFPDGSIRSFLARSDGPEVIFEARVYRTPEEAGMGIYTSGWAREVEGKTPVNRTSHLENCESSAVGRALANLGYATDARRPSRAEMIKVARVKDEHEAMLQYIRAVGAAREAPTPRSRSAVGRGTSRSSCARTGRRSRSSSARRAAWWTPSSRRPARRSSASRSGRRRRGTRGFPIPRQADILNGCTASGGAVIFPLPRAMAWGLTSRGGAVEGLRGRVHLRLRARGAGDQREGRALSWAAHRRERRAGQRRSTTGASASSPTRSRGTRTATTW